MEGQTEFAFGHGLVRDVAYAQIPRLERVRKHEAAAGWLETIAGDRVADHAELLAHHYREALELARAAGVDTKGLEDGARRFLWLAAERAAGIDLPRAASLFEAALALTPSGHPTRGRILTAAVESGVETSREEALSWMEEALAELRLAGDEVGLGKAVLVLSQEHWYAGDAELAEQLRREAVELLERHEPGAELAHAYSSSAGRAAIAGRPQESLEWAAKAIPLAERLGLDRFVLACVQYRGLARCRLGDLGGLDDLREALRVSLERGLTRQAVIGYNNYGSCVWLSEGAADALPIYAESVEFNERRGRLNAASWSRGEMTRPLFDAGKWDELLEVAAVVEEHTAAYGRGQPDLMALTSKARVLFYRGRREEAEAIVAELLPRARAVGDPQVLLPVLSLAALVEEDANGAVALVEEMLEGAEDPWYADSARVCVAHGALEFAERMIRTDERVAPRFRHVGATVRAILAEARGERDEAAALYRDALRRWTEYPFVLERALCLLGLARATGEPEPAAEAQELFRSLGAETLAGEAAAAA